MERLLVRKEHGAFDSSREFDMLAFSCVRKGFDEDETDNGRFASCVRETDNQSKGQPLLNWLLERDIFCFAVCGFEGGKEEI